MTFGEWLRQSRERKGWSGERLAEEVETSQGNISMYERGQRTPRREMVVRLANALGTAPNPGLLAAGFSPEPEDDDELAREPDRLPPPTAYDELWPENRELVDLVIIAAVEKQRQKEAESVIGSGTHKPGEKEEEKG